MNAPQIPSAIPLLQLLESYGLLQPGTVAQVNTLAEHVKGLGNALKSAGVLK